MIQFNGQNNTWVMRITADRRIEVNEDVEVNEAAQKVLDAMQHLLKSQRTWVELTESEKSAALYDKDGNTLDYEDYADAIEAKSKEKNHDHR